MKRLALVLLVAFHLGSVMVCGQKATINLNNIEADEPIVYQNQFTGQPPIPAPVPVNQNFYVRLYGGTVGGSLTPIFNLNGESVFAIDQRPGYFDGGIGIVPGIEPGGVAAFELVAWQGDKDADLENDRIPKAVVSWTQTTGVWNDQLVPQPQPVGEVLRVSGPVIFRGIPEPSVLALLPLGLAMLMVSRSQSKRKTTASRSR